MITDISLVPLQLPEVGVNGYTGFKPGAQEIIKKGSTRPGWSEGETTAPLACDIIYQRDIEIRVRDGARLYADIFRPVTDEKVPCIVSWSPYGKEYGCLHFLPICTWKCGIRCSEFSGREMFEGADPGRFCPRGYAVVNVDIRGSNNSDGKIHIMGEQMRQDGCDVIEALAKMDWCNGNIGMAGNSFLAISQYQIASAQPPSLKAIAPFEGAGDIIREQMCRGGMVDLSNMGLIYKFLLKGKEGAENFDEMINRYPFDSPYWQEKRADMSKINIPTFISGSQCTNIHTMGSIRAWLEIPAKHKYMRWAGHHEWYHFYARAPVTDELVAFFDVFLKGQTSNGFVERTPKIRWTLLPFGEREPIENIVLEDFPPKNTEYRQLFFGPNETLVAEKGVETGTTSYLSTDDKQGALFTHRFDQQTNLIGLPKAHIFISCKDDDDMNVIVMLRKLDKNGKQLFHLMLGRDRMPVPTIDDIKPEDRTGTTLHEGPSGFLRASRRHINRSRSIHEQYPFHTHDREEKVTPGDVVELEIGIWAMGMRYEEGEHLQVRVFGCDSRDIELAKFNPPRPNSEKNHGVHTIHFGGQYPSRVILPVVPL